MMPLVALGKKYIKEARAFFRLSRVRGK